MLCEVILIDQDVVQIDNDIDIYHIRENVVHESLKAAGVLVRPSGITNHLKDLYRVQKAVFHLSPSVMYTR